MADLEQNYASGQQVFDAELEPQFNWDSAQSMYDRPPLFRGVFANGQSVYDKVPLFLWNFVMLQSIVQFRPSPWFDADTEGSDMSTAIFPELPGLMFDIKRRPIFNNKVQDHVSGKETRLAFWDKPKWEFELSYEYVPNLPKATGYTDLEKIMGFFIERKGNFQTFLYRFQDDCRAVHAQLGVGNGLEADFAFVRKIGPWSSEVDFVDNTLNPPHLYWSRSDQAYTIGTGPYTVNAADNVTSVEEVRIGAAVFTPTAGAPAAGQYHLDPELGVFTFNSIYSGQTVVISYEHEVVDAWEYQIPNRVTFFTPPPTNVTVYADFDYYFNVRFGDAEAEFNLFMDKLYELQEITLRSVPV